MNLFAEDPKTSVLVDGEELPGFILYGLWSAGDGLVKDVSIRRLLNPSFLKTVHLCGDSWKISCTDVAYERESEYFNRIQLAPEALEILLLQGSLIAWIGSEGLPVFEPPSLFSPKHMGGSVILAKAAGGMLMRPSLDCRHGGASTIPTIDNSSLEILHALVAHNTKN